MQTALLWRRARLIKDIKVLKHEVVQFAKKTRMNSGAVRKCAAANLNGSQEHSNKLNNLFIETFYCTDIKMNSEQ